MTSLSASARGVMTNIRVVVAEDNFLAREGISSALGRLDGIELVATSGDLPSARAEIDRTKPDVVISDIRLPPDQTDEGIQLALELRKTHPRIGVVILSHHLDPFYATTLFAEGSNRRAYILKERLHDIGEFERAIRSVAEGGAFLEPRIVDELLSAQYRREHSPLRTLTERELEVLELIAEGRTNRAIASELSITRRGVERHINSIFGKLELGEPEDVSRRVMAALFFLAGEGRLTQEPPS